MRQLISRSRLVVHSYDSTGILETLSSNVPTLCFWHGGLGHLRASALPYYEQLRQAGILFDSPEAAAQKVSEVWGNVPAWWNSEEVQNARTSFCDRYARVVIKPIKSMKILWRFMGKILDLGCGTANGRRNRLDVNPRSTADIVHDLNIFPYRFQILSLMRYTSIMFSSTLRM